MTARIHASGTPNRCAASGRTHVLNGRFRGGWTTRHYGRPAEGLHAIQMELAQASHLGTEEPPFALDPEKAETLRALLADTPLPMTRAPMAGKRLSMTSAVIHTR